MIIFNIIITVVVISSCVSIRFEVAKLAQPIKLWRQQSHDVYKVYAWIYENRS